MSWASPPTALPLQRERGRRARVELEIDYDTRGRDIASRIVRLRHIGVKTMRTR